MTSEPEPKSLAAQRHLLQACWAVERGLECVTFSVAAAHPTEGCLPLPDLRAPKSAPALTGYAAHIEATLWRNANNWNPAWSRRLRSCTHGLDPFGVSTVFDLIQAWRSLISRAADHAAQRHSHDAYDLDGRLTLLAQAGHKTVALRAGEHG